MKPSDAKLTRADREFLEALGAAEIQDVCAASVETKSVEWLWHGHVPLGKLTIFDGDPDVGKSVVTMDLAARVSSGRPFPDGAPSEAGNVLIVNVEDGIEDTIVPRLKAHGANLERIFIFSSIPGGNGGTRLLDLPGDIPLLEQKVAEREAVLLIIDPVLTMLGGDANRDQDARKALTPVRDMAERTGTAVIAVRHLNKSVGLKAIQRGGGNMGLIGVARAGAFFAEHPDDDGMKVMAQHKSNLAEKPPSLVYKTVNSREHGNVPRVEWSGTTEHDANSLAADALTPHERSELEQAKEFLRDELSDGPMWAKEIHRDAESAGVAYATLRRAKTALRVKSDKVGTNGWMWELPPKDERRKDERRKDEDEHHDHVEHLEHLQNPRRQWGENSAYVKEGAQDVQDAQDDHRDSVEHVHEHLPLGGVPEEDPSWPRHPTGCLCSTCSSRAFRRSR